MGFCNCHVLPLIYTCSAINIHHININVYSPYTYEHLFTTHIWTFIHHTHMNTYYPYTYKNLFTIYIRTFIRHIHMNIYSPYAYEPLFTICIWTVPTLSSFVLGNAFTCKVICHLLYITRQKRNCNREKHLVCALV